MKKSAISEKTLIIIIAIIAFSVIVSAYILSSPSQPTTIPTTTTIVSYTPTTYRQSTTTQLPTTTTISHEPCEGAPDRETCLTRKAIDEEDSSYCEIIETTSRRDNCFYQVARITLDYGLCEKLTNIKLMQYGAKDECYHDLAYELREGGLCGNIISMDAKDHCYFLIGLHSLDEYWCSKIVEDESEREICYRDIADCKNDYGICERIEDDYSHDTCMIEIVRETHETDISVCNRFVYVDEEGIHQWKISCEHEIETGNYLDPADIQSEERCGEW